MEADFRYSGGMNLLIAGLLGLGLLGAQEHKGDSSELPKGKGEWPSTFSYFKKAVACFNRDANTLKTFGEDARNMGWGELPGTNYIWDNLRSPLPKDIAPTVVVEANVQKKRVRAVYVGYSCMYGTVLMSTGSWSQVAKHYLPLSKVESLIGLKKRDNLGYMNVREKILMAFYRPGSYVIGLRLVAPINPTVTTTKTDFSTGRKVVTVRLNPALRVSDCRVTAMYIGPERRSVFRDYNWFGPNR